MSEVTCLSNGAAPQSDDPLRNVRVSGGVSIHCKLRFGASCVVSVAERDGYKVRIPQRASPPEAILINTGGGTAGGDHIVHDVQVDEGAALTVTTQASERIYKSTGRALAEMKVHLHAGEDATLNWLPQDTILFDRARLSRQITADISATSKVLLAEALVFGRPAMGETLTSGLFRDRWRVRRGGRLVFAEDVLLQDESFKRLAQPAMAQDARATLTLLYSAPDAEDRLTRVREIASQASFSCAASVWNGLLVVRALSPDSEQMRKIMADLAPAFIGRLLPRVWWT